MNTSIPCLVMLTLAACGSAERSVPPSENDLGSGANTVERKYAKSVSETWEAAMSALKRYDLVVKNDRHDGMGGELQATRASGDRISVHVQSLDDKHSEVSVRVEPGNRNLAEMIHEKVADNLGLKEAKLASYGGNICEGIYPKDLEGCIKAAEGAAKRLNLSVTNRELKDDTAVVDGREVGATVVQFKMKAVGEGTKVAFTAGPENSERTRDLAYRMKTEFEAGFTSKGD